MKNTLLPSEGKNEKDLDILPLVSDFFTYLQTNNYSPETIYNYKKDILYLANFLQSRSSTVDNLNKKLVNDFKGYITSEERLTVTMGRKSEKRFSAVSTNRCLSVTRSYIRFLIEQDYPCPVMPEQFKLVKTDKHHPHVAAMEELVKLIEAPSMLENNAVIATRNRAMLEVMFSTGMRISELLSLNKRDLNDSGSIFITGKGRKQRLVYLTNRAKFYIEEYLKYRNDLQQALFVPTKGRNINKSQRRISPNYLQEKIKRYRERLKINIPVSAHSLRHGFATYLAEEGASPVAIQILLGHESLNTTTRYVNASDKFAEETHRRMHPLSEPDIDKHPS